MLAIAGREFRQFFISPLGWVILAVVQIILAWLFLSSIDQYMTWQAKLATLKNSPGITDWVVEPLYNNLIMIIILIMPLITMRLISDERRMKTMSLLFSSPLSSIQIVLGKYLGVLGFFLVLVVVATLMPISLLLGGTLDMGKLIGCVITALLMVSSLSAIGLFFSSLTAYPAISAISTFGFILLLWVVSLAARYEPESMFHWFSLTHHYRWLLQGIMDTRSIAYFMIITVMFLGFTILKLYTERN